MAWANSGLYASVLAGGLTGTANLQLWTNTASKFALTNNSDVTSYNAVLASAVWSSHSANEVSGTGWAAGGVLLSVAAGGSAMTPSFSISGTAPVLSVWQMSANLSVTGTTLASAYGGYFVTQSTTLYTLVGIYFGGSAYSTTAGTFAITWASSPVAGSVLTISCGNS
jgi:hypothetical protein